MTALQEIAQLIPAAQKNLDGIASRTPIQLNSRLSRATGCEVWLKREDLQPVRSYKLRGAYNLISQLTYEQKHAGVVCASAGNHGQGVAFACSELGIPGIVFVPTTTPRQKRQRIIDLGQGSVELVMEGATYDQASQAAKNYAAENRRTLVPAFDHPLVTAGQATAVVEAIDQLGFVPDVVLLPVGGGGLISGAAAWLRTHHPQVRIIGVEPEGAPSVASSLAAGKPVALQEIDTFIDGAAVSLIGDVPFSVLSEAGVELIHVPEGQVCSEMLNMYQIDGIIAEPAGALAPSALPTGGPGRHIQLEPGTTVLTVISGGNNDVERYAEVLERSLIHEGRKRYFVVDFPQEPGALRRFLDEVLGPDDDITYFEYVKRSSRETGPALVGVELGNPGDYRFLLERITTSGMQVEEVLPDSPYFRLLF